MSLKLPPFPVEYLELIYLDEETNVDEYTKLQSEKCLPFVASEVINSSVISANNLTQGDDVKKVIEVSLNIKGSNITFLPGNTIGVIPQNNIIEVNKIIQRLNYTEHADKLFVLSVKESNTKKKFKIPAHIPVVGSIREIFLNNLDIRSIPKKAFLRALSKYCSNEEDVQKLDELCSQEGSQKYIQFITIEYVPLLELLKIFPSCFPPFSILLEHLPRLLPRPYSLTSLPENIDSENQKLQFIYSITPLPKSYEGICTSWMNKVIAQKDERIIPIYQRKLNNFTLPENSETNIIMIATGTGIAPFMSFLRNIESNKDDDSRSIWLFYGCRYHDRDYLYKSEIENFVINGIITKLYTSFSRETNKVKYVQDNIVLHAQSFIKMLKGETILYVCGSKNMNKGVFDAIVKCIHLTEKISLDEAQVFVNELRKNNNYIEDIWD